MPQNLFKIYDGRNGFWQWDTGQKLIVLDDNIDEVHFSTKDMMHALVSKVDLDNDGLRVCYIPDIILTLPKNLIAYAYILNENMTKTIKSVKFPVTPRPIPSNYVSNQNDKIENILKKIEQLENAVGAAEFKKFNTMEEAKLWAKDNDCVGLLISVNIDGNWVACIIEDNDNIFPIKMSIDTSLTQAGSAADAKAVGDALNEKQPKGNYLTSDDGNELDNRIKVLEDNKADWNQNDETAKDYVKNRTHYEKKEELEASIHIGNSPIVSDSVWNELYEQRRTAKYINYVGKYEYFYDGDEDGTTHFYISDPERNLRYLVYRDSSLVAGAQRVDNTNMYTNLIVFYSVQKTEVHQLDEKFIPDSIARITDIPEIPEHVQADWNQNDPTAPNYIKNRPFYTDRRWACIHEPQTIQNWNGNWVSEYDDGSQFLNNNYPDGTVFKIVVGSDEYVGTYKVPGNFVGNGSLLPDNYLDYPDTGEDFAICYYGYDSFQIITRKPLTVCKVSVYMLEGEEVHKIDPKYLPDQSKDWNQNDPNAPDYLKNRPFYYDPGTTTKTYDGVNPVVDAGFCTLLIEEINSVRVVSGQHTYKYAGNTISYGSERKLYRMQSTASSNVNCYIEVSKSDGGVFDTLRLANGPEYSLRAIAGTVSVIREATICKLDEKFIPDTIARINDISEAVSTDDEIIDMLIQEDMLFAIADSDGSILVDENNNILTW